MRSPLSISNIGAPGREIDCYNFGWCAIIDARLVAGAFCEGRLAMTENLGLEVHVRASHDQTLERVLAELRKEGFGVLTRIDIHGAFKQILGRDFRRHSILGACNPQLAYRTLSRRPEAGLTVTCTITVEADPEGGSVVRIANPETLVKACGFDGDDVMHDVAAEAFARLKRVAESLAQT